MLATLAQAQQLGILPEEFEKINQILGRTPNFTELSIFSVMWSEHCSYKNSIVWLKTLPRKGARLLVEAGALDTFRRQSENLYERVRALLFLYAIHRFHLPTRSGLNPRGLVPFKGYTLLLQRRFVCALGGLPGPVGQVG